MEKSSTTIITTGMSMSSPSETIKQQIKETYSGIALQTRDENATSCCGVGGCSTVDYAVFAADYSGTEGYVPEADLGLGCGLPVEFAQIQSGDVVVDLGSGAGNDAFIARAITGASGRVIGIDMTPTMIEKARNNAEILGFTNVEFRLGDIEDIPMASQIANVVVSNCVLNLVPNKVAAFREMYRILKPGGHFSISDVVLVGELPPAIRESAEMWAGCVSGAIQRDEYMRLLSDAGFVDLTIQQQKAITLPTDIVQKFLSESEISEYQRKGIGLFSITVYGQRPTSEAPCGPQCSC